MNITNILNEIEKIDPEVYDRLDTRRDSMRQFAKTGSKIALASLPFALGGMFKKAYGGTKFDADIVGVLNFALTLEYLERRFYIDGLAAAGLIPDGFERVAFQTIASHEQEHVAFLITTILELGGSPVAEPTFDYTAGGTYADVFTNYNTFLSLSQTYEDTGVRAYKGQAGNLITSDSVLTAALRIHSVEARHASYVRSLRGTKYNDPTIRPWITRDYTSGIGDSVQATYAGEENTVQLGIEITDINGSGVSNQQATEAFDEPLTMDAVLAIVDPFIVD